MPALLPIDKLSELVNMGTLLAFAIVCAGVWILRRRNPEPASAVQDAAGSAGADPRDPERAVSDLDAAVADEDRGHRMAGWWGW